MNVPVCFYGRGRDMMMENDDVLKESMVTLVSQLNDYVQRLED